MRKALETIGKAIIPKKFREGIYKYYEKVGRREPPYMRYGIYFVLSAILTAIVYLTLIYPSLINSQTKLLIGTIAAWIVIQLLFISLFGLAEYILMDLKIFRRTREIEKDLADYLELVSANLKGGMTIEQSLWNSIRPEFKVLGEEMGIVAKKVMTGEDIKRALSDFSNKYDSTLLKRTFEIFIGELTSGGEIVRVLEKIVNNIRSTQNMREEMSASTLNYVIFISIIVMFIAPTLFALSYQLITIISDVSRSVGSTITQGVPMGGLFRINAKGVDTEAYKGFSLIAIMLISLISSIIISIIQKGNIKEGLKYIPFFIIASLMTYVFLLKLLGGIFGGLV